MRASAETTHRLRGLLAEALREVRRSVSGHVGSGVEGVCLGWLARRLAELDARLAGAAQPERSLREAVLADLDRLPSGCQPRSQTLAIEGGEDLYGEASESANTRIATAIAGGEFADASPALRLHLEARCLRAAARLACREGASIEVRDDLEEAHRASRRHVKDESARLQRLLKARSQLVGEASTAAIDRELDRLSALDHDVQDGRLAQILDLDLEAEPVSGLPADFDEVDEFLQGSARVLAGIEAAIADDQKDRLRAVARDHPGRREEVEAVIRSVGEASPQTVEDQIALLRDGHPLDSHPTDLRGSFEEFYPAFAEMAFSMEGWPSTGAAFAAATRGEGSAGSALRVDEDMREGAAGLMAAWFDCARKASPGKPVGQRAIEVLLGGFGFERVQCRGSSFGAASKAQILEAQMSASASDWFLPPAFGSRSGGRWRVVLSGGEQRPEQIASDLRSQPGPAAVLVPVRLSAKRRLDFAREFRRDGVAALLIDESLAAFLATRERRLEALFDAALPFGLVKPYTTDSGALPPEMFFGRAREIELIERQSSDGCLVYGGRQLGKSALLHRVEERNRGNASFVVRRAEITTLGRAGEPAEGIWARIAHLLSADRVLKSTESGRDAVRSGIRDWLGDEDARRVLLLLDETDRFMSAEARSGFPNLTALKDLMESTDRRFRVVFAGLHNVRRMLETPNSPLAHLGEPICVGPLTRTREDKREARRLVLAPMRAAGFAFEEESAADDVLTAVNHYPSLAQVVCKEILERMTGARRPSPDGPLWSIPRTELEGLGHGDVFRKMQDKFRLTLRLDPRYEAVALGLGLAISSRSRPAVIVEGLPADEVWAEVEYLWPPHTEKPRPTDFRALLDELHDLGVLGRDGQGSTALYRLRSQQVANMLGTVDEMSADAEELIGREAEMDYDPAVYRKRSFLPILMGSRGVAALVVYFADGEDGDGCDGRVWVRGPDGGSVRADRASCLAPGGEAPDRGGELCGGRVGGGGGAPERAAGQSGDALAAAVPAG